MYLKDYALLDRNLIVIFLPNPLWVRGLLSAAISTRIELEGCGCITFRRLPFCIAAAAALRP